MNDDSAWFTRLVAEEAEKRRREAMDRFKVFLFDCALLGIALLMLIVLTGCATPPSKIGQNYDLFFAACECGEEVT